MPIPLLWIGGGLVLGWVVRESGDTMDSAAKLGRVAVAGGYLLAEGGAEQAAVDAITGGAGALAGVVLSFWDKKSRI